MNAPKAKAFLRAAIAAPGLRHGLRWFLNQRGVPETWRDLAHRKLAKHARFGDVSFRYVTPDGTPLRFLHSGTSNYLYWLNTYEPETTSLFCQLAARARVIMDIGAADGIYAILAAAANPQARILAFEPGDDALGTCTRNVELNLPITQHVELHAMALGEHDMESVLYVAGESGGTSSLNPHFRAERREQRVIVRTGDGLLRELAIEHVDLVKIDTESTEPAVLRGLLACLARDTPDLICEILLGRTEQAVEQVLKPLGYQFYWITSDGLIPHDSIAGDPTYRNPNYLFSVRSRAELAALGIRFG